MTFRPELEEASTPAPVLSNGSSNGGPGQWRATHRFQSSISTSNRDSTTPVPSIIATARSSGLFAPPSKSNSVQQPTSSSSNNNNNQRPSTASSFASTTLSRGESTRGRLTSMIFGQASASVIKYPPRTQSLLPPPPGVNGSITTTTSASTTPTPQNQDNDAASATRSRSGSVSTSGRSRSKSIKGRISIPTLSLGPPFKESASTSTTMLPPTITPASSFNSNDDHHYRPHSPTSPNGMVERGVGSVKKRWSQLKLARKQSSRKISVGHGGYGGASAGASEYSLVETEEER